jgi:hypothetical protein
MAVACDYLGALRANIVRYRAALATILSSLYTFTKARAVYVFIADIALVGLCASAKAVTRKRVKGVVLFSKLTGTSWAKEVILAELAFVANVATTLAKAFHVPGVATRCNISKGFEILIAPHITPTGICLLTRPTNTSDRSIPLLSATLFPRTLWILFAVAWRGFLTPIFGAAFLPLFTLLPFYLIIAARIRLVVASVASVNLGAFAVNTGVARPTVIARSASVIASPSV